MGLNIATGEIKLPSLQSRRQFINLYDVYKQLNGYYEMEVSSFFHIFRQEDSKMVARSNFFCPGSDKQVKLFT